MFTTRHSHGSSERQKWDKIFNGLVKMLKSQQEQLQTLVTERKILEDRIKMQHEKWVSDINLYEDHITQMKSDFMAQEMTRLLEAAKSDMMVGLKNRETSLLELKLEHSDDNLADFRAWFDLLRQNPKDRDAEARKIKLQFDKLASEKRSEVSALLAEKDFIWHQYKLLENDLTTKLNSKRAEVDQANEKIAKLLANLEELQSSNNEKDELIAKLNTQVADKEAGTNKCNDEISRLSRELELLRKSRSASVTPLLNPCVTGAKTSNTGGKSGLRKSGSVSITPLSKHFTAGAGNPGGKNCVRNGSNVFVKKELSAAQVPDLLHSEKCSRSSKRKAVDVCPISETPKLFTSKFKVPKLKASPCVMR
ncbi:hypothetical protein Pint_09378 [Pistacia integerrima]|uniref:Uncharacterized protein n=1 Tax=Pistacia integerrima TaxID=434235 RepID=A0ACC0XY04_9ROSI|nr:hypothetical protein Pint_09378 [Pistacia integerrima]